MCVFLIVGRQKSARPRHSVFRIFIDSCLGEEFLSLRPLPLLDKKPHNECLDTTETLVAVGTKGRVLELLRTVGLHAGQVGRFLY